MGNYFARSAVKEIVNDAEIMEPIADTASSALKKFITEPEVMAAAKEIIADPITDPRVTKVINAVLGEINDVRRDIKDYILVTIGVIVGVTALFYNRPTPPPLPPVILPTPPPPPTPPVILHAVQGLEEDIASSDAAAGLRVVLLRCDLSSLRLVHLA